MNIRVYKSRENIQDLKDNLIEEQYEEMGTKQFQNQKVKLSLFIEKHDKDLPVWVDELVSLFALENTDFSEDLVQYNGIIIAETRRSIYMIAYGHAFWIVERNADLNFGMDFAERAIKEDNITLKGVSFIQRNKMRGVMNYKKGQNEFPQASESYFTLSGIPDFEVGYGKNIDCGIGVKFQKTFNMLSKRLELKEKNMNDLADLFNHIDETMTRRIQSTIPRLQTLKRNDPDSIKLDEYFLDKITGNDSDAASISIDINRIQLTGDNIEVIDNDDEIEIYLTGLKPETSRIMSIDSASISNYLVDYKDKINNLDRVQVKVMDKNGENLSKLTDLRSIMYCELEVGPKVYIFQNGSWGYLNEKFLELLDDKMVKVNEVVKFNNNFNLTYENPAEVSEKGEHAYIKEICKNKNYIKLHKRNITVSGTPVEIADIYCKKNKELIAIKRGTETGLAIYSFEQSVLSIQAISNPESFKVREGLEKYNTDKELKLKHPFIDKTAIKKIMECKKSSILWLVKNEPKYIYDGVVASNFKVSDIKSLLLKLKILNWYSFVRDSGYEPTLYFALDQPLQGEG